ncbi:MAG: hypothetical protein OEZ15_00560 [Gammaproteobacteria bacterium]|nr:hypothetical protein [Gammaproteobacteria bacterium]
MSSYEYFAILDVPKINRQSIYNYRAVTNAKNKQICQDIKLAEGLYAGRIPKYWQCNSRVYEISA